MKHGKDEMILDMTCGAKQMWFQKNAEDVVYLDKRKGKVKYPNNWKKCGWSKAGNVNPTIQADNRYLPFKDNSFNMVLFDPPFRKEQNNPARMDYDYTMLNPITWTMDIGKAAKEGFRVLKHGGFFIFKWGEGYAVIREALKLFPIEPLFGTHINYHKHKTWWIVFRKD